MSVEHGMPNGIEGSLPSGTMTLLFTDLEGSTRLAETLGARFSAQLAEHDRILREAISANQGTVVSTAGDSFFAYFPDAAGAVASAVAAQHALAAHPRDDGVQVRVRMGLHTGPVGPGGRGYIEVARASRIMAAAHGGQVLLSDATRGLVAQGLPAGVRLQTLGTYRLKDLPGPERLHQLEINGLPSAFPPPRALDVRRASLPPEATRFIGRAGELDALAELLAQHRLVTMTGPGGTGKTRLALRTAGQIADRFADGAFFVTLAAVTSLDSLPAAVALALNLPEDRTPPDRGRAPSLARRARVTPRAGQPRAGPGRGHLRRRSDDIGARNPRDRDQPLTAAHPR